MQAIIFCGIQGTGKSTFYRQRFFHSHLRINLDQLRTRHREAKLLRYCIETSMPFVVDNTNPTRTDRARYISVAREAGFTVIGYYFESPLREALRRNEQRLGNARIPAVGVLGCQKRLKAPVLQEGFHALYRVRISQGAGAFVVEEWAAG